ncbi:MAG: ABC transporter permease, partial [Cyclobacteriaceae bacterium]|nr:ABC transporter permease [Cyclobacteriaceae bacterium]
LRDIKVLYKQTILGFMWAILNPFFNMIVFSVVFGNLAKVPSDGVPYPVFSFAALLPWTYFSQSLMGSTNSLVTSVNMFTKVYFPRLIIPMTSVFAKLVDFLIAFLMLIGMMFYYDIVPGINLVFIPVLVIIMILTAAGIGMWLSALAIQYRDVKFAMTFLVQLLMYAAPVVWPVSLIEEKFGVMAKLLYGIYPMAGVIEGFRAALLNTREMPWDMIAIGGLTATFLFVSGIFYYRKMERIFADVA